MTLSFFKSSNSLMAKSFLHVARTSQHDAFMNALFAAENPCWRFLGLFFSCPLVRRSVRSTSAASRRDAERARQKLQVPNIASKAFLSLKSLALKAYLKARFEISDLGRLSPHPKSFPPGPHGQFWILWGSKMEPSWLKMLPRHEDAPLQEPS